MVINRGIKTKLFRQITGLGRATRDPHHTTAFELGNLTNGRTHSTRGRRHHQRFTGLWFSNGQEAGIGRHSRHAQNAQGRRYRCIGRIDFPQTLAFENGMALPSAHAFDKITRFELRMATFQNLTDRSAHHHRTQSHRRGIGGAIIHAAAHIGIKREVMHFHQHLALGGLSDRYFFQTEIRRNRRAHGPRGQNNPLVFCFAFHAHLPL